MNEEPAARNPYDRSAARALFISRVSRYRNLLAQKWWLLLLGPALGLAFEFAASSFGPSSYSSVGRMIVNIKLSIPEGSLYAEEMSTFLVTQTALMQSSLVTSRAYTRVTALHPSLRTKPVSIRVSVQPKTSIFILQASGEDAAYTQAYLQACMEEYINLKKEMRTQTSDTTVAGLTEEVLHLEKELRKCDQELADFQSSNSVVVLQEQGNSAGSYLATLTQRLAALKSEYDLLQSLTPEQNLERQTQLGAALPAGTDTGAGGSERAGMDYSKAKQELLVLKAEQAELQKFLRPKHPKLIAMNDDVARRERLLSISLQLNADQLENRKQSLLLQIQNATKDVNEWDARNMEISRKSAEYQRIKSNTQRVQALYDRLLQTMQTLDVNKEISPESVTIMESACAAFPDRVRSAKQLLLAAAAGLALSLLTMVVLNRLDDRLNSFTELQEMFDEPVLGQVPKEQAETRGGEIGLLRLEDPRSAFVEAYRNLRSSLLFMTESGKRPKTLLVTSSVPDDGKSLTAANFALTLASSGSRVLLVDADLRKGALHKHFEVDAKPGLTEALAEGANWEGLVRPTQYPNLSFLPRGAISHRSSEFFVAEVTRTFLEQTAAKFEFVVIDTAPVMAADDVTSLAPRIDGVLFVIRAEQTSARIARAALDLLYHRQVRVLGLVFNAVNPTSMDYQYYYKYRDYYATYPAGGTNEKRKVSA